MTPARAQMNAAGTRTEDPPDESMDDRDLSFFFFLIIYHPLSQLEIPAAFRKPFPPPLSASANVGVALTQINDLLAQCDYLRAAHMASMLLLSGAIRPTDHRTIFHLLAIRYSCLELSGNVLLAAQEAKSLEDLGSTFYYTVPPSEQATTDETADNPLPEHVVPFSLRLQALRLQSIGFSDPRRGVSALYDLGAECRDYLSSPSLSDESRHLWSQRMEEVNIRVINALIEMGDIDCARRTLDATRPMTEGQTVWALRRVTLYLRMGLLEEARQLISSSRCTEPERLILESLLAVAEDRLDSAIGLLNSPGLEQQQNLLGLARQNLAVAYLYKGDIQKAKDVMETLISDNLSFQTLTINLATVYDLTSDRSQEMKTALVDRVASQQQSRQSRAFTNADFKL